MVDGLARYGVWRRESLVTPELEWLGCGTVWLGSANGILGILGTGVLLAPEQKVVVQTDPDKAREIGRPAVERPYRHLRNYTNNPARVRL